MCVCVCVCVCLTGGVSTDAPETHTHHTAPPTHAMPRPRRIKVFDLQAAKLFLPAGAGGRVMWGEGGALKSRGGAGCAGVLCSKGGPPFIIGSRPRVHVATPPCNLQAASVLCSPSLSLCALSRRLPRSLLALSCLQSNSMPLSLPSSVFSLSKRPLFLPLSRPLSLISLS